MKKKYLILFIIFSFFSVKIISHQPLEPGLFFSKEYKKKLRRLRPTLSPKSNMTVPRKKIEIIREKRISGVESSVFQVNDLSQFLFLVFSSTKPIIAKLFSLDDNSLRNTYQKLADNFKDKAIFISINAPANLPLLQIFLLILCSQGVSLAQIKGKFPIFLFCKKDFAVFHNGSVSFKKDGLQLLAQGQEGGKKLSMLLEKTFNKGEKAFFTSISQSFNQGNNKGKVSARSSILQKMLNNLRELKKWFKKVLKSKDLDGK